MAVAHARYTEYERRLFERAAGWSEDRLLEELSVDRLCGLAATEGIDFATALLYQRLVDSPPHGSFIECVDAYSTEAGGASLGATLVVVPGAFYDRYPQSGADGRLLREEAVKFGCHSDLIPLPTFGSLAENARTICSWLRGRTDERIILASVSKGGADVKMALARPEAAHAFRNVVGWVNLCGLLQGSPLINWALVSKLRTCFYSVFFRLKGVPFRLIRELAHGPGYPLAFDLPLPKAMKVVHVVGFPLTCHAKNRLARRCFDRLAPLGPNDGAGIVLGEVCRLPGLIYPLWSADHYLRPVSGDVRHLAVRLLHYVRDHWLGVAFSPCTVRAHNANSAAVAGR